MSKVILPITQPTITTLPGYADALAILQSRVESLDWVYSQYLQFYITKTEIEDESKEYYPTAGFAPGFFGDFDNRRLANTLADGIFLNREACPYLNIFELPNELMLSYDSSFVSIFKRLLDRSMYIYAHTDASKIKAFGINEEDSDHPILLFGYDDTLEIFHFADFVKNDTYSFTTCSYEEIELAFKNSMTTFLPMVKSVAAVQFTESASYIFDFNNIRDAIHDYVYPDSKQATRFTQYAASFYKPLNWKVTSIIGSDAYGFLSDFAKLYIELKSRGVNYIDVRPYHAFCDHKAMMQERLEYFLKKGFISHEKSVLVEQYREVVGNLLVIRNMILKYNIKQRESAVSTLDALLSKTKEMEISCLKQIFSV